MLQDYRRRIKIKPFAPVLKDQSLKRWKSDLSIATNISLLSISNASQVEQNENNNNLDRDFIHRTSPESILPVDLRHCEEQRVKHVGSGRYIFNKHVNGTPSTISTLVDADVDPTVHDLFYETKTSPSCESEDYDPRAIRPPPFAQYIEQLKRPRPILKPRIRRSPLIPVRMTRSEQLKLARQQSATMEASNQNWMTKLTQPQPSTSARKQLLAMPPITPVSRPRTTNHLSFMRSESARSCAIALHATQPLHYSPLLAQQMQQEIQDHGAASCSQRLTRALLQEQSHDPLDQHDKTRRIYHWLDQLIPTDYLEHNESASIDSTLGTACDDKIDDEFGLLSDEALPTATVRTYAEAHRVLPIFQSAVRRKTRQYNLMLTLLELDLYVM